MTTSSVSSTTSSTSTSSYNSAIASLTDNSGAFLQLLLKQLEVQDPTDPVDTSTYVSQLTSLAQMEQEMENGDKLDDISTQLSSLSFGTSALGYLGKTVEASGDTTALQDGSANWSYSLGSTASSVKLSVVDSNGATVYSTTGDTSSGSHAFTWDGTTTSGGTRTSGTYTLKVTATNSSGNSLDADISVKGKVTAVDNSSGSTVLDIGGATVSLSDVTSVAS